MYKFLSIIYIKCALVPSGSIALSVSPTLVVPNSDSKLSDSYSDKTVLFN